MTAAGTFAGDPVHRAYEAREFQDISDERDIEIISNQEHLLSCIIRISLGQIG